MTVAEQIEELWREQSLWSCTANRLKARVERARLATLVLTTVVAVIGATASGLPQESSTAHLLAAFAAFGAALIPMLRTAWNSSSLSDWTRARSVSEALKGEIYLWLARAGEYRHDDQATLLTQKTDDIRASGADLAGHQLGIEPIHRALPQVNDARTYFSVRVRQQIFEYYQPKAEERARRLRRFRRVEIGLAILAATIAAAAATTTMSLVPWIAAITTTGAAVAVHVAASRYDYQLIEYLRTAAELRRLTREAGRAASEDALDGLVTAAEAVISVENQAWMARLAEDVPDPQTPQGA